MEETKKIGIFRKFIYSLYKPKAYNEFLKQSTGKAILYIFLLSLVLGVINSLFIIIPINSVKSSFQDDFSENIPDFQLKDGVLSIDADMPIKYVEDENIVYVDTENPIDPNIIDEYETGFLITSDSMIVKQNGIEQSISFNTMDSEFVLNKDTLIDLIPLTINLIIVFFLILYPIFIFIQKLLFAAILALFGILIGNILKKTLSYSECFRLSLYSLTLPMVLTIFDIFGIINWMVFLAIALFYLFFGIKALDDSTLDSLEKI